MRAIVTLKHEKHKFDMEAAQNELPRKKSDKAMRSSLLVALDRLKEEVDVIHLWTAPEMWQDPQRHQRMTEAEEEEEEEEARKATWTELFFDLVYVAAGLKLGAALKEDVSLEGILTFIAVFLPIYSVWVRRTQFVNHFNQKATA